MINKTYISFLEQAHKEFDFNTKKIQLNELKIKLDIRSNTSSNTKYRPLYLLQLQYDVKQLEEEIQQIKLERLLKK